MLSKALQAAAGNAGAAGSALYVDDVFSTYLYTGNGSTQTITNNIDLAGEGGMVWLKARTSGGSSFTNHAIIDTVRGKNAYGYYSIYPNLSDAQFSPTGSSDAVATAVSSSGFTVGGNVNVNYNTQTDVSWTFRKAEKFFDIQTYTGNGANRTIAHNLGSVPGFIVVKRTSSAEEWFVYHRSEGATKYATLNDVGAFGSNSTIWNNTAPTSSVFSIGTNNAVNLSGATYVAYLFAHDAGGFGADGSENVISCGSFTTDGSGNATVNLGYEPQWLVIKNISTAEDWYVNDIMRGLPIPAANKYLIPNTSAAEGSGAAIAPTSTGFSTTGLSSSKTYIYVAIRRPMKPPTVGTEVFSPYNTTSISLADAGSMGNGVGATAMYNMGFVTDAIFQKNKSSATDWYEGSRLQGNKYLIPNLTSAEASSVGLFWDSNKAALSYSGTYGTYGFKRASGFMDVVCYTGTGVARTVNHNLTVAPEMMIVKRRDAATSVGWVVYNSYLTSANTSYLALNLTDARTGGNSTLWNATAPTDSVFSLGTAVNTNASGGTYVAYLFATYPGVSKVGSYTGTGTTKQVNCGFTSGARFVLIKRTDSTGDWYVWDSARGIVAGNDPYLLLNSTAAEVTGTDYVDTYSAGFEISSTAPAAINANGGSFIFFAVA